MRRADALNFHTLTLAFSRGDVSVVSCHDSDGHSVNLICTLSYSDEFGWTYVPFATLIDGRELPKILSGLTVPPGLHGRIMPFVAKVADTPLAPPDPNDDIPKSPPS